MNYSNLIIGSTLILIASSLQQVQALTSDSQQPIHINSAQQIVNMLTNTVTMIGDVIVKRGSIDIHADKVIITRYNSRNGNKIVEGFGNPATLYQLLDDGKPIRGYSKKIRYETANDLIVLTGNAYLEQLDSNIKGDNITYLIKKNK